jgi:hypothetical protein
MMAHISRLVCFELPLHAFAYITFHICNSFSFDNFLSYRHCLTYYICNSYMYGSNITVICSKGNVPWMSCIFQYILVDLRLVLIFLSTRLHIENFACVGVL